MWKSASCDVARAYRTFNVGALAFVALSSVTVGPPPGAGPSDVAVPR
ncbi:hypothetical protein GCM10009682_51400 [Luedemannella flava]|uniref:Uncharacterized protein n=1 Tax=Luedemannella flava TaxID=349316 RepID=A0ABP4YNY0_9ACTN